MKKLSLPLFVLFGLLLVNGLLTACATGAAAEGTYSLIDGVFTDANGNEVNLNAVAARGVAEAETAVADGENMLVVEINGTIVENGAMVVPGQSVVITMTIPANKMVYGFPGGNTGGSWLTNATVSSAPGCEAFVSPGTVQFNCQPHTEVRTVIVNATATKEFFLPEPVGNWPYSSLVVNPSPEGAEEYHQWEGIWWQATDHQYLPTIYGGGN